MRSGAWEREPKTTEATAVEIAVEWETDEEFEARQTPRQRVVWGNDPQGDFWRMPCACGGPTGRDTRDSKGHLICGPKIPLTGGCEVCGGSGVLAGRVHERRAKRRRPSAPRFQATGDELERRAQRLALEADIWSRQPATFCTTCSGCGCTQADQAADEIAIRDEDIRRRTADGEPTERLAEFYGLSTRTIRRIKNGNSQRPQGRYGGGGVKKPNKREREALRRYESELRAGTWRARGFDEVGPYLELRRWPKDAQTGRPKFWGGHTSSP